MRHHLLLAFPLLLAACGGSRPAVVVTDGTNDVQTEAKADNTTGLTAAQAKTVLQRIDSICGDSWCEGDFDFKFVKIKCDFNAKTCTLTAGLGHDPDWTYRSCKMGGIPSYDWMLQGGGLELSDDFYDKVDACIDRMEASVPSP